MIALLCPIKLHAAASLSAGTSFIPADSARSAMDIGGVWNGTSDVTSVTGDTITVTLTNGGDVSATGLSASVLLPAGFFYVANTVSGLAGITASQAGTTLTLTIPGGDTIAASGSATVLFGLYASSSVAAGTYALHYTVGYNSGLSLLFQQNLLVKAGATTLGITPATQTKSVTQTASYQVVVTNTGLGGLFDVKIDESLINPNVANSLQISGMTQTFPISPAATGSSPVLTLPYLAAGSSFTVTVTALVTGCANITNTVSSTDRTTATSKNQTAAVAINLQQPLITYTPGDAALVYGSTVTESINVQNMGMGDATSVILGTNLNSLGVTISNVAAGWSYNAGTGQFTKGATLTNGVSSTLSFDISAAAACSGSAGGTVFWASQYTNTCGDQFVTPSPLSSVSAASNTPTLTVTKSATNARVKVGTAGEYVVTLNGTHAENLASDPVSVTDVLPVGISGVSLTPSVGSASCIGPCVAGSTVTWKVSKASLPGPVTLTVDFTAPSNTCLGGTLLVNQAVVTSTSTQACVVSSTGTASILLINNPDVSANFNIDPVAGVNGTVYETGVADNGDAVRQTGEGEFIQFISTYSFSGGYPGTWSGSSFQDDYGGLSSGTLVTGTLQIQVDGGSNQSVPGGSVLQSSAALNIDLTFLAGASFANDANVAGHSVRVTYKVTHADIDLGGQTSRAVTTLAKLTIQNGGSGSCGGGASKLFTQGTFYTLARAQAVLAVSGVPSTVDICQPFQSTFTITNATVEQTSNILSTVITSGDYDFLTATAPAYGGQFNGGNITYTANGGTNPTFSFDPSSSKISTGGTVSFYARRKAVSNTTATDFSGQVDFDDNQTGVTAPRDFTTTASAAPLLIRKANLKVTVTPQTYTVTGSTAQWTVYVTNLGNGTAYNAMLVDRLPTGLTLNTAATNALNPSYSASINLSSVTWSLGDMTPGQSIQIQVFANSDGTTCSIPSASNLATASWGCGGSTAQSDMATSPDFTFPAGQIQILHDTTSSFCALCDNGKDIIIARNVGSSHVLSVNVQEALNPVSTGLSLTPGTVEKSIDGGVTWNAASNPTGTGTTGDPYVWTSAQIAELADLYPQGAGVGMYEVRIRFTIAATETTNGTSPTLTASASGSLSCGNAVSSPGTPYSITVQKPDFTVTKTGRNVTKAQVGYTSTVYASASDSVEWKVVIQNNGAFKSENTRLGDVFPNSGAALQGTMNGTGYASFTLGNNTPVPVPLPTDQVSASGSVTYLITQAMGTTCVNQANTADVTWGCSSNGANVRSNLSSPTNNTGVAQLVMIPDYSGAGMSQVFTALPGGRTDIAITVTNNGGPAQSLVLTDTLPSGQKMDASFTPTISSTGGVSGMTVDSSNLLIPIFTLTGTMAHSDVLTIHFRIIQTGNFDTIACPFTTPETVGNSCDPTLPPTGNNVASLAYQTTCSNALSASNTASLDPQTPDLDISVNPPTQIIVDGSTYNFDYTIINNGDSGSIADHFTFTPTIGAGFTGAAISVTTAGTGGTGGVCGGTCTSAQLGTLAQGQSAVVRITVTAHDNGGILKALGTVTGTIFDNSGASTGNNYSFDQSQEAALGVVASKTFVSQTESFVSYPNEPVGGDVQWKIKNYFFGNDPASGIPITAITVRDSLPSGLGLVSVSTTTNTDVAIVSVSSPTPVNSGTINYSIGAIVSSGTFEANVTARVLNIGGNTDGKTLTNSLGTQFTASSHTFASNNGLDGFGGSQASLHAQDTITVKKPVITFAKAVKNVTTGSAFAHGGTAQGGDQVQYRLTLTNTGHAPAYDLFANDLFGTNKLQLIDDSVHGGTYDVAHGSVTFNGSNTTLVLGQSLQRLDPGQSISFLYSANALGTVVPSDVLANGAGFQGGTLPGNTGSQNTPLGNPGTSSGEALLTGADSVNVTVSSLTFGKSLITTSVGGDASPTVYIGEQAQFQIQVVLPNGTVPSFNIVDHLPKGLTLVQTATVQFGTGISGCTSPTFSPGSLPASGNPLLMQWTFGTCTVSTNTVINADRTITVGYKAQVENTATTLSGNFLVNNSSYNYTGAPANASAVTLTVAEPSVAVTKTVSPLTPVDAGDILTYTVSLHNTGAAPAYDVAMVDTLPAGVSYQVGTTNATAGGPLTEPDVSGATLTWGRTQSTPQTVNIAAGGTLTYTYQVKLADTVTPNQIFTNSLHADWTSLSGSPGPNLGVAVGAAGTATGERTGTGGANTYTATVSTTTHAANSESVTKTASGATLGSFGGGYRIGDLITYTLQLNFQEGTLSNVRVQDTLPTGLAFVSFTPITPVSGSPFTYTAPTGANAPAAASTGTITWTLGTVVNAGDNNPANNALTLVYQARIMDTGGLANTPATQTPANSAVLHYDDGASSVTIPSVQTVSVKQPILGIAKALRAGQSGTVQAGDPVRYRVTVSNTGTAPAYDTVIQDQLPVGLRQSTPSVVAVTLNGLADSLSPGYVPATGLLTFTLSDVQAINPGQTLVLDYNVTVDSPVPNGASLVNSATVTQFFSKDSTDPVQRRQYPSVGPAVAAAVTGVAPSITLAKTVNLATANPGDTLHYQVTITNAGNGGAFNSSFTDNLDANLQPGTLSNVVVAPSTGTLTVNATGGTNGTGLISIANMGVAALSAVTVNFDVHVSPTAPFGAKVYNQASFVVPGYVTPFTSNVTTTTLQTAPILHVQKTAVQGAGSPLKAGDTLTYTLVMTNSGNETAVSAVLLDAIPAQTGYVSNSTQLNGVAAPDVSGVCPLVSGLSVNAPANPAGQIPIGSTATVTFQVTVSSSVLPGTLITNQGRLEARGITFGPLPPELSDDPTLPGAHDPTQNVVGILPVIYAVKTVTNELGGTLLQGNPLTYQVVIRNIGSSAATGLVFTDAIPVHTHYIAGSLKWDPDGSGPLPLAALTDASDGDAGDYNVTTANALSVKVGTLAVGAEADLTFRVTVDSPTADGTLISNQGVIRSSTTADTYTDGDGNMANGAQPTVIVVGNLPALQFAKTVADLNGGTLQSGHTLEYTLSVTNVGASSATNVTLKDPVPPSPTTYVAGSTVFNGTVLADDAGPASPLARLVGYNIGALFPGRSAVVRFRTLVPAAIANGTAIVNNATVQADTISPIPSSATLTVGAAAGVANVSGIVWRDLNHNKTYDTGEALEPGWLIQLWRFGQVYATATSDAQGAYAFTGIPAGSGYEIRFLNPINHAVFGSPVSLAPGVDLSSRTINNLTLPSGTYVLNQSLPLDPSGIVYDSVTRKPIAGAKVHLNGPGGADITAFLLPGQQDQITGADGLYELDLIGGFPSGVYTLALTPPSPYSPIWPSGLIPPQAGSLNPVGHASPFLVAPNDGAPTGSDSTTYYTSFVLSAGYPDILNNHLPIDPIVDNAIVVTKTAQLLEASRGDLVPYTITATNRLTFPLGNINLQDFVPPGFKYRTGSARLNGVLTEPAVSGRTLTWTGLSFTSKEVKTFKLLLTVGSGVSEGSYVNQAWAVNSLVNRTVSNVAEATVKVVPDPTFDCTDIIGKVFLDKNRNGYPDPDEPGIPGVRLATPKGWLVTTDEEGRYHIACAMVPEESIGSNFILKVDPRTLPAGSAFTTENPLVWRLTRGKFVKMNFGVALPDENGVIKIHPVPQPRPQPATSPPPASIYKTVVDTKTIPPLHFAVAHFQMEKEQLAAIKNTIADLQRTPGVREVRVRVVGHTDSSPIIGTLQKSIANNDVLSRLRAQHVADYVSKALAMDPALFPIEGRADRQPVATNNTPEGRAQNRRVEFEVVYEKREAGSQEVAASSMTVIVSSVSARPYVLISSVPIRDFNLKFDNLSLKPVLNVTAWPDFASQGDPVIFSVYSNYHAFFERAEVRLLAAGASPQSEPLAILPVGTDDEATWMPYQSPHEIRYVVRVYDGHGHFDETAPKTLVIRDLSEKASDAENPEREKLIGYGKNHLAKQSIPLTGGTITLSGKRPSPEDRVRFMGRLVPIDPNGLFVAEELLPSGQHDVVVRMAPKAGPVIEHTQTVYLPRNDWFYVALGDITVGNNTVTGPAALVTADNDHFDGKAYVDGHTAFYLKGKIKGQYLLTASADSGEAPLRDMFQNWTDKDPQQFLRQLDPARYYPVYGDDSTLVEDAPTQGKFYVRLERGDSHILWGNFKTRILGNDFAQIDRALYGGNLHAVTESTTKLGEKRAEVNAFAAQPGTLSQREEFRGSGGSLYYLQHQNITTGSERVRTESRDKDSGIVLGVTNLVPAQDYDVDPIQGRILLRSPLASTVGDGQTVHTGDLSGNPQYLVVTYEYQPALANLSDMAYGGRAESWVTDHWKVGATGSRQRETSVGDQDLLGADTTLRYGPGTYVKSEVAQTKGPGSGAQSSLDGGFGFTPIGQNRSSMLEAQAFRTEGAFQLQELFGAKAPSGQGQLYYQHRDSGFSAPGQLTDVDTNQWGAALNQALGSGTRLSLKYDQTEQLATTQTRAMSIDLAQRLSQRWSTSLGLRAQDVEDLSGSTTTATTTSSSGQRTDGAWRLNYDATKDWSLYGLLQGTIHKDAGQLENSRYGGGTTLRVTDRWQLGGEATAGSGQLGGKVTTDYRYTDRTDLYMSYLVESDRSGEGGQRDTRTLVSGAKTRYTDALSVYGEEKWIDGNGPAGITHSYGTNYSPTDRWTFGTSMEKGSLDNTDGTSFSRTAATLSGGYHHGKIKTTSAVEGRDEESSGNDRHVYLFKNDAAYQMSPDWRTLIKFNYSHSTNSDGAFNDGNFTESVLGFGYRPTKNDRLNALFKYTYFYNLPTNGQLTASGTNASDYTQRSHIGSIDASYDVARRWTIGGKYGLRYSALKASDGSTDWIDSLAQLAVLRLDYHVVKKWDILAEGRTLQVTQALDSRTGALVGIYRHINDQVKFGGGYNFTNFSDDLTDLSYRSHGWFINLIAGL